MAVAEIENQGLTGVIRAEISAHGTLGLDRYMALCLGHPKYGYYMTRDPFGKTGDFITAPEISQVFGELIGVWVAHVWQAMASPHRFSLVELGPGRGTLMRDALRAAARMPGLADAARVHFVETSPVLRAMQRRHVPDAVWHDTLASLPAFPAIVIANEFFDAIPIRQFEQIDDKVFERKVDWHDGALRMVLEHTSARCPFKHDCVFEEPTERLLIAQALGHMIKSQGGAALVIDYGHRKSAPGDTLQAMKDHAFCGILESPGKVDLTSHVDFEALLTAFRSGGARGLPLLTQAEFLEKMGIGRRTEMLARKLEGSARENLESASQRFIDANQMGLLFKVACATHPAMPAPYPFDAP
jgi:NADH dehydrogenase [ubiquinone] 1 alpha subcomplex assembly factor 7